MSTSTLQNFRVGSDLTVKVRLKDGGVAIDWSTLSGIRAVLYSDAQSSIAGRCDVTVDGEDPTLLVCRYAATKMQYLGVNRIVVSTKYMGETKTYDKPAFTFVRWTADQDGEQITIKDPEVTVEITVEDISSSILQEAVNAAFSAADRAEAAAQAAEHMVDIKTGPAGKSPYKGENGNWFEWDEEAGQYVDTGVRAKGDTGDTPDISIGTVTTVEPGEPARATMTGTPEAPVLNLSIPKGAVGSTPNISIGTVTTGAPGTPVVITITGTAEAPVLNVTIPQGMKGDTGVSADYPITIYNGLDSDATDAALSAAQGKVLDGKISQLRQEVHTLSGKYYGVFASANDLPEGDGVGYAFVGENEPFAIWNFDGTSWSDSGSEAIGLQGPQGNSGYTGAVGELEVVNNLEDGGATAALSAEMGKLLSRNMKLLYDSMGAAAFWSDKPNIDWSGNGEPVSISLTKCSINNLASTVPLGEPYQATITPDAGAILETVSCVMNGETQTVTNGVIDIAEVTGAIIITAVAYDLDSVAYESLTYKQLFETNNVLGITAGFENGSYSPLTVKAGSPSITTEDKDSGTYSLKCSGTSSQQVRTSSAYTVAMLIACRCKVTSYTAGSCGIQSGGVDATLTEVSDWVTKTANRTSTASGAVFLGSLNSANLTGYVDTPVVVQKSIFTTAPSLSDFTALYNKYVALKKL